MEILRGDRVTAGGLSRQGTVVRIYRKYGELQADVLWDMDHWGFGGMYTNMYPVRMLNVVMK